MHRDGAWGARSRAKAGTGGIRFAGKTKEGDDRSDQHKRRSRSVSARTLVIEFSSLVLRWVSSSGLWLAAVP
jgi:hypothetical protein